MNLKILNTDIQCFINNNLTLDVNKLILKGSPFLNVPTKQLVNQIISKQKSKLKLPTWFNHKNIYYPSKLSIEQTSSEVTAKYKANLISGDSIIDITGGFGVDSYFFSRVFKDVTHCEVNDELSEIATHNFKQLQANNITTISTDGLEYLKNSNKKYSCVYIDPSRRSDVKGKVFLLKDCLPNVPENIDLLFKKSDTVLIKNSPMLDISSAINELKFVKEIHIVALENEVKELLFLLQKEYSGSTEIKTTNITKKGNHTFNFIHKSAVEPNYSLPLSYLYEPNSAILKSGGFHQVTKQCNVYKLHQHTHLYTSDEKEINFPGRKFEIINIISYDKKLLKKILTSDKANITTRNFPKTVAKIRQETKLKDGGNNYLFFTKNIDNKYIVIICKPFS